MKRASILVILFFLLLFVYWGCTKTAMEPEDNGNINECIPKYPDTEVTYEGYAKNIFNTYCISCHNGGGAAPGSFRTYDGVLPYLSEFKIRVLSDNADMPQGNAPLPKNIRDSLTIWIGNCAPEK